jgi:hypothetical protein
MGWCEPRQMLTAVRRVCGQDSIGPTGDFDQSIERMRAPISPLPERRSAETASLAGEFIFSIDVWPSFLGKSGPLFSIPGYCDALNADSIRFHHFRVNPVPTQQRQKFDCSDLLIFNTSLEINHHIRAVQDWLPRSGNKGESQTIMGDPSLLVSFSTLAIRVVVQSSSSLKRVPWAQAIDTYLSM